MSEKGRRDSAKVFADPLGCAVVSIGQIFEKGKNADGSKGLNQAELVDRLADAVIRLQDGKMDGIEEMLLLQAHTLQALATKHIMRMAQNAPSLEEEQFHVGVAMKAMNQCRQTLHTLGELKNPRRSTFVKQQNNAVNQQINQGKEPKTEKLPEKSANGLLEEIPSERLEFGTAQEAVGADQAMATVAEVDRAEDRTGKEAC